MKKGHKNVKILALLGFITIGGIAVAEEAKTQAVATFGAGCFWCVEHEFQKIEGVQEVISGFMGGHVAYPTYEQVVQGGTGHSEVAHVLYDPTKVSYQTLVDTFWKIHDPTQLNRQGPDVGYQYRSVIFYHNEVQQQTAEASKATEGAKPNYRDHPIVTTIEAAGEFYPAEAYHQDYYARNPAKKALYETAKKLGLR